MDLSYITMLMPSLMQGLGQTLLLFALTLLFSLPLGLVFTLGSISKVPPLRWVSRIYIWIFRGTPLMLQLFFIYYGLPFLGIAFDRMTSAVVTFVLNYAAYFAEIYRAGIQSIDRGQHEAAKTLGFTPWQTMRFIILPQTVSRVIPSGLQRDHHLGQGHCACNGDWRGRAAESGRGRGQPGYGYHRLCAGRSDLPRTHLCAHRCL